MAPGACAGNRPSQIAGSPPRGPPAPKGGNPSGLVLDNPAGVGESRARYRAPDTLVDAVLRAIADVGSIPTVSTSDRPAHRAGRSSFRRPARRSSRGRSAAWAARREDLVSAASMAQEELGAGAALLPEAAGWIVAQCFGLGGGVVEADDREGRRARTGHARARRSGPRAPTGRRAPKRARRPGSTIEQRVGTLCGRLAMSLTWHRSTATADQSTPALPAACLRSLQTTAGHARGRAGLAAPRPPARTRRRPKRRRLEDAEPAVAELDKVRATADSAAARCVDRHEAGTAP